MKLNNLINRIKQINSNIKFVGEFDNNNQRTGYWEEYWDNGNLRYNGNYINGLKDGYWEDYWVNGNLYSKEHYYNNVRHGTYYHYNTNGNLLFTIQYYKGVKNGNEIGYYNNEFCYKHFYYNNIYIRFFIEIFILKQILKIKKYVNLHLWNEPLPNG